MNLEARASVPDYFDGSDPRREIDRREKPGERRTFEVAKIWEQHDEIIRRLLVGQKASHIAADMGVSRAMISYVRNSQVVKDKLLELRAKRDDEAVDMASYIKQKAPEALELLEKIIDGDIDAPVGLRAKEANNWLDRAGYSAVRNANVNMNVSHFTKDDIEEIKRRAVENGFARPSALVNVTPVAEEPQHD